RNRKVTSTVRPRTLLLESSDRSTLQPYRDQPLPIGIGAALYATKRYGHGRFADVKGESPRETEQRAEGLYSRLGWPTQAFWQEQLQPAALEQLAAWGRNGLDRPWAPLFEKRWAAFESDEFWDLLGTAYLRTHDYTAASAAFARL